MASVTAPVRGGPADASPAGYAPPYRSGWMPWPTARGQGARVGRIALVGAVGVIVAGASVLAYANQPQTRPLGLLGCGRCCW